MQTIVQQIFSRCEVEGSKPAIISGTQRISYAELKANILKTKHYLEHTLQLKAKDFVLLGAHKAPEFLYTYCALQLLEAVAVPLALDTNPNTLTHILTQTQAVAAIGLELAEVSSSALFKPTEKDAEASYSYPDLDSLAEVIFTSGTTGNPKGVLLSHRNISASAGNINQFVQTNAQDTELIALPISHSFGLGRLRCCLTAGATIVLLNSFVSLKKFFRLLENHQVTGLAMVPSAWAYIHKMSGDKIGNFQHQIRYIEYGSAKMPKEDKQLLMQLLPNTRHCMHFGLTEASRTCFMEFHQDSLHLDTIGKASPNVNIQLLNEEGETVPVGEVGEICVQGAHLFQGYLDGSWTKKKLETYFPTGDLGRQNPEGFMELEGRKTEQINVGGKKLAPLEVEELLNALPKIKESACVGIPDKTGLLGQVVKAYIVAEEPKTNLVQVQTYLSDKLEPYKIPQEIEWVDEIPKTKSGKIQRHKLVKS